MNFTIVKNVLLIKNNKDSLYFEFFKKDTIHIYLNKKNNTDLIELNHQEELIDIQIKKHESTIEFSKNGYCFLVDEKLDVQIIKNHQKININFNHVSSYQTKFSFDSSCKVFGLGDKMNYLNKVGYEYESWATDDSKHHDESFKSLYKAINYLLINNKNQYIGIFFPSTYKYHFDICKQNPNQIVVSNDNADQDFYIFINEDVKKITSAYSYLVGHPYFIRYKMLGNNQSRFTYKSSEEVMKVVSSYYDNDLPLDYIHLDIDYMDGFRDFTVNKTNYPSLKDLTLNMKEKGVELVVINDAGIKVDSNDKMYDFLAKNKLFGHIDNQIYVNTVWPGESAFPNYFDNKCKTFINKVAEQFVEENNISGIWNDMNEPASFHGELPLEVDFSYQNRKLLNEEAHNVYAEHMIKSLIGIYEKKNLRPYLFSRAAFATTAKYAFVWNGDNASLWHHLKLSIPQILSMSLSNFMINGVDIGGFNEDITKELLIRWIESATFTPFMRNHSSINTKNQEPYAFDKETLQIYSKYLKIRYSFASYLYNLVYRMNKYGELVNAPMFYYYQDDQEALAINDQYMVGPSLMVAPILDKECNRRIVYFPEGEWVDYFSNQIYKGNNHYMIKMDLSECGIYIKNNSIIPLINPCNNLDKENIDTLIIKIYGEEASFELYDDDGKTLNYQKGECNIYQISYKNKQLNFVTIYQKYSTNYKQIKIIKDEKEITIPFEYNFAYRI